MRAQYAPILETRGLSKTFGHVEALVDANLVLYPGEILALVGDNGAGKSTLIKIISGACVPDRGDVFVNGGHVVIHSPGDAARVAIATVYQELALVDTCDVGANVFLGREFRKWGGLFVDWSKGREEAGKILARMGSHIPSLRVEVGQLSGGQRQAVAICRALARGGQVFIMDEPTAALGVAESEKVLKVVRDLKNQGVSIIIVSHNLQHVFSVADRITVMRHGRIVGSRAKLETTMEEIVQMIVGARAS